MEHLPAGPTIEELTRRLAECPPDFLLEPRVLGKGIVHVPAVVSDLMRDFDAEPLLSNEAQYFEPNGEHDRNRAQLILVVAWLLHHPALLSRKELVNRIYTVIGYGLSELANLVEASKFVTEAERREELVRYCLSVLGLLPQGESAAQAQDRFTALSSVCREQVLRDSREAQERVRRIREQLLKKAAQEAAAKVSRE